MNIQKPKGTEDIFASKMLERKRIINIVDQVLKYFNYQQIDTPIFESYELFDRSIGETTDVVNKEMYDFYDKSNRHLALRPEGTAGVVRSYLENKMYAINDICKLYYIGKMYRYERPGNGRQREFTQIGIERIGKYNPSDDAEIILLASTILEKLGIKYKLKINNIGETTERNQYIENLQKLLEKVKDKLSSDSQRRLTTNPLRILDSKTDKVEELIKLPNIKDFLSDESNSYYESVKNNLDQIGIKYNEDMRLVRGLDYYTNLVFEFVDPETNLTILGGGRYNNLINEFSKMDIPAIGFGAGLERIELLTKLETQEQEINYLIISLDPLVNGLILKLAKTLRNKKFTVEVNFNSKSIKSSYAYATKINAQNIIFVGAKEQETNSIVIKNLKTKEEKKCRVDELEENI
jgi:histidyl-tRNA synthetase